MESLIDKARRYCAAQNLENIALICPFALDESEIASLRGDGRIKSLTAVLPNAQEGTSGDSWLSPYDAAHAGNVSRNRQRTIVFLGGPALISGPATLRMLASLNRVFVCRIEGSFQRCTVRQMIASRLAVRFADNLRHRPLSHPIVRIVRMLRRADRMRRLWRFMVSMPPPQQGPAGRRIPVSVFDELVQSAHPADPERHRSGKVVFVNAGLAPGGAERQICTTLSALCGDGQRSFALLSEYRSSVPDFPPYAGALRRIGVPHRGVPRADASELLRSLPPLVAASVSQIPSYLIADTLSLVGSFRSEMPDVVHAWQDATNIRAGLAAVIAGVPRIILAARNVNPTTLLGYQPHMLPAYRALLARPEVSLVANSRVGADSYADWLEVARDRIAVIPNAFDPPEVLSENDVVSLRRHLAIGDDNIVVGGVFRLVPQKRPLLWVDTAAHFAAEEPNAVFVIAGEGPLRHAILQRAAALGLRDRLRLLETQNDIGTLYRLFDAFLLTSQAEGMANVLLEAQYAGVPIVCCDAGGNREAVLANETAIVSDSSSPEFLASALVRVTRESAWRTNAMRVAPQHVRDRFSPRRIAAAYRELYERSNSAAETGK